MQARQPAQRLTQLLPVAGRLPVNGRLAGRDRLAGQPRQVALHRVVLQQLGAGRRGDPLVVGQHGPVVPDRLPVGRDRRRLPGRLRRVPQHGLDIAGLAGVVDQPGNVDPPFGAPASTSRTCRLSSWLARADSEPSTACRRLVTEPDRLLVHHQQPGRHPHLDRRRRRPQRRLQQPQLGPGRDHRDQPHGLLGVGRQAGQAGQDQVADGHGHAGVAGGQDLGDQQRVPAGQARSPAAGRPARRASSATAASDRGWSRTRCRHPLGQAPRTPRSGWSAPSSSSR